MLRQLIGQVQELLDLYGSPPPPPPLLPPPVPPGFLHLQPRTPPLQLPHQQQRWCLLNLDDNTSEDDDCYGLLVKTENPKNFNMLEPGKAPPTKRARRERNRVKLAKTSTESMEEEIWKEFPEDLYEAVIARLPIATFFRFRSVCRKWNSLLTSHSFSLRCAEIPPPQPWFYTMNHEDENMVAIYDPTLKKWHHPAVPALPEKRIVLPVASAGGLLCFLDIGHRSFYVCNPLTTSFKELPTRLVKVWARVAVGMTIDRGTYRILWVTCDGEFEVYDSVKNCWTRPGAMPSCIKLPLSLNFKSQAVTLGSSLYFLRSDPEGIVSYDTATGVWKQFVVPAPVPLHLSDHTLAECGGRIILAGLLTRNAATCVCIWELQKMTLLWKEVDRMPNIWCLEFYGKHVRMSCLGNRGLLMLSLRSRQMNRLVTYDVLKKEWLKVPSCVLPHGRKRPWITCGTAFHPCLTAVV